MTKFFCERESDHCGFILETFLWDIDEKFRLNSIDNGRWSDTLSCSLRILTFFTKDFRFLEKKTKSSNEENLLSHRVYVTDGWNCSMRLKHEKRKWELKKLLRIDEKGWDVSYILQLKSPRTMNSESRFSFMMFSVSFGATNNIFINV